MNVNDKQNILDGKNVLVSEAKALAIAAKKLGKPFSRAVNLILTVKGKVITTGIGKSGIIARRIASILSSTGTPSFYMHPVEGIHGDIGIFSKDDALILLTHSGKSDELLNLLPYIKRHGIPIILISKDSSSSLAKIATVVLETGVNSEACPYNLVPTTSSAVATGLGDALAIALMKAKKFRESDYKLVHPAGELGKRLLYRVSDLMVTGETLPLISKDTILRQAVSVISQKRLGVACVVGYHGELIGIITDGDIRRAVERNINFDAIKVSSVCTKIPKTVFPETLAVEALSTMEKNQITTLVVLNRGKKRVPIGMIHLHHILRAGVV